MTDLPGPEGPSTPSSDAAPAPAGSSLVALVAAGVTDSELLEALRTEWRLEVYAAWRSRGFAHRDLQLLPADIRRGPAYAGVGPDVCRPVELSEAVKVIGDLDTYLQARIQGMTHDETIRLWTRFAEQERRELGITRSSTRTQIRQAAQWANRDLELCAQLRSRLDQATIESLVDNGVDMWCYARNALRVTPVEALEATRAGIGPDYYTARKAALTHDHIMEAFAAGIGASTYMELREGGHSYNGVRLPLSHTEVMDAARSGASPDAVQASLLAGASATEVRDAASGSANMGVYGYVRWVGRSHRFAMRVASDPIAVGLLPSWDGTLKELLKVARCLASLPDPVVRVDSAEIPSPGAAL